VNKGLLFSREIFLVLLLFWGAAELWSEKEILPHDPLRPLEEIDRNKVHVLKVGYVELEGYPVLSHESRLQYENLVEQATLKYLSYKVDLQKAWVKPAPSFYESYEQHLKHPSVQEYLSWDIMDGDLKRMKAVADRLKKKHGNEKIWEYILPKMSSSKDSAKALLEQSQYLFKKFSFEKGQKGKPILDRKNPIYHSFWTLNGIQVFVDDVDILVVNQLICIPDEWMPLYSMARGGVTTGAVDDNHHRPLGGTAFMSLYPFLGKDALFNKLNPIPDDRRLEVAAVYTTHELGHLLGRRAEIYDHAGCVSKAATGLDYWKWFKGVEGKTCSQKHPVLTSF
jgi:hypothetical protein